MLFGKDHIVNATSEKISFFPLDFAVTKICVAMRLAEDGKKRVTYSFNYPLVYRVN